MTALATAARRLGGRVAGFGIEAFVIVAVVIAAIGAAAALVLLSAREPANAATIRVPPARAAALIQATTGDQAQQMRAVGEEARMINAALPFASGPLNSLRPFAIAGSDLDQRRALLCLTQAVYYEAGFEPEDGRRAVAQVVLNRMRHPAFPKSVCGVVYQNNGRVCQFTFACDGSLLRAPAAGAWRRAQEIARAALGGYVERSVGSATHYHADYVAPRWAPLLAKVAVIGQHIFYRWPGAWGQPGAFSGRYIGEPRDPLSLRPVLAVAAATVDGAEAAPPGAGPVTDGTILKRAPNDVGGLLDTSKGWTLSIPDPAEIGSGTARLIAAQERKPAPVPPAAESTAGPLVASR